MKLVLALATSVAAFTGPVARLPTASVSHMTKLQQQPRMLLGGLRARANKALVSYGVRDVAIKHQRGLARVNPSPRRSPRKQKRRKSRRRRRRAC